MRVTAEKVVLPSLTCSVSFEHDRLMGDLGNSLLLGIGKRRTLKKLLRPLLPDIGRLDVTSSFHVFFDLKDVTGPSFYINYGGGAAFYHYEEAEKAEVLRGLSPEGVFLDVGANIGLFSIFIARYFPRAHVFAFEPHPLLQRCLKKTADKSQITNLKVLECAVGSARGSVDLFIHKKDSGGHSIISESIQDEMRSGTSQRVEMLSLDEFAEIEKLTRVDFIKIDAQEAEEQVIQGAQNLIRRFCPRILIECDNTRLARRGSSLLNAFEDRYQFRMVGSEELFPMKRWKEVAEEELKRSRLFTNYVLIPN